MMFEEVIILMYNYIRESEFLFLTRFKLNPIQIDNDMTILDLVTYLKLLEQKNKREQDSIQKRDFEKALVSLRDILIFMTMGKEGLRMKL